MISIKKFLIIFILSFSLGFLLVSFIAYARQTIMSTYYPSPSGTYTKIQLRNQLGTGPNENSSAAAYCLQTATGYDSVPTAGHTYINAGTIFADPANGSLEICKADGSVASYPGAAFSRFCTGANCSAALGACPPNYTAVNTSPAGSTIFSVVTSYSCVFNNVGTTYTAKSGCFSNFSITTDATHPTPCSSVDPNAYDVGCQIITTANTTIYKRDCCFNIGPNALGVTSSCTCASPLSCVNHCGPVTGCGVTLYCGICPSGFACDAITGVCSPQSCNACLVGPCPISGNSAYPASIPGQPSGSSTIPSCPAINPNCGNAPGVCDRYYHGSPIFSCYATNLSLTSGSCAENECAAPPPANSLPCPNSACYYSSAPSSSPFATSNPPLNNNTAYTLVGNGTGSCSTSDCQVYCPTGYLSNGVNCILNQCVGGIPANSILCPNTPPPINTTTPYTLYNGLNNCPSNPTQACTAYCPAGFNNSTASGSYTTAAPPGSPNTTNTQNGRFCTTAGSVITGVSDACQGTNSAGVGCTPTFFINTNNSCVPSSIPEQLACTDNGQPGCGTYPPSCTPSTTCGQATCCNGCCNAPYYNVCC